MQTAFEKLLLKIGQEYSANILNAGIKYENLREVRFNCGHRIELVTENKSIFIGKRIFAKEIADIFAALCEYSVHTYKNEICEGFITAEGGFRVGICGTAIYEKGEIIGIKDISALNIRIPHEIFGAADKILPFANRGMLIIGSPCSGKTTLLRDIAKQLSNAYHVLIVDERREIAGIYRGETSFNIGRATVLNGFYKSDGIKTAARSMAPDIIICDEFGDEKDLSSAVFAMKSGVSIIASMHAFDKEDFLSKPFVPAILKSGIFKYFSFLNKNCEIYETVSAKEIAI